jgi:hypothetical protein
VFGVSRDLGPFGETPEANNESDDFVLLGLADDGEETKNMKFAIFQN